MCVCARVRTQSIRQREVAMFKYGGLFIYFNFLSFAVKYCGLVDTEQNGAYKSPAHMLTRL